MNPTRDDIERIVRKVIGLLRAETNVGVVNCANECNCSANASGNGVSEMGASGQGTDCPTHSDSAVCADRVITVSSLGGYLDGVERLVIQTGAVITPAAKDLMRDRGITWSVGEIGSEDQAIGAASPRPILGLPTSGRLSAADSRQVATATRPLRAPETTTMQSSSTIPLIIGASGCTMEQQAAMDSATLGRWNIERTELGDLLGVVERVTGVIAEGSCRGLLLTDRASLAVSLANRQRGVRAVAVRAPEGVPYAVDSTGMNLLIVDATTCDGPQIASLLDAYRLTRDP